MSIKVKFREKLSKVLFVTLKKESKENILNKEITGEFYILIRSALLANDDLI